MSDDRLPPQNKEAEMSVIGGVLRDNAVLSDILQIIRPDNFYYDAHQKIFQIIIDLYNEAKPVDLVILGESLIARKQLEDVGGSAYIAELWDSTPTAANAEYHARIVRDKAVVRNLIHASTEILRDAYDGSNTADEMVAAAERKVLEIAEKGTTGDTKTLIDAMKEAYDRIDARTGNTDLALSGLPTGFIDLDNLTAGFQNSELIIIAARPSVGKCLTGDSEIVLADGSVVTVAELYRRRRAKLLTLGADWKLSWTEPSAYVDDHVRPVYRVRTRLGRRVEATACHPLRTVRGWVPVSELKPGDRIAVPRRMPVFGTEPVRECEAKLLAYLIGDGGLTDTCPEFTNGDPRVRADFAAAVAEFGGLTTRTPTVLVSADRSGTGPARSAFAANLRDKLRVRGTAAGSRPPSASPRRPSPTGRTARRPPTRPRSTGCASPSGSNRPT